jgi:hypothetical protein
MSPKMKRVLIWVGVALVLFYVISNPVEASGDAKGLLGGLGDAADSIVTFMRNLFA